MKKFSFSLEQVLQYKNQILENLQQEHAAIIQEMNEQLDVIQKVEDQISDCRTEFAAKQQEGIPLPVICSYENYLKQLYLRKEKEEQILEIIHRKEEIKRQEVLDARIESTSFEKLKENRMEQYRKDAQRAEEQFVEEFVSHRRMINQGNPS